MSEGYSKKGIADVLNKEQIQCLVELVEHPGWYSLKRLNQAVKEDWINQAGLIDISSKTDDEMVRIMRTRNGMIKGIDMFMAYVERQASKLLKKQ